MQTEAAEAKRQGEVTAAAAGQEAVALHGQIEQLRQVLVDAEHARDAALAALAAVHVEAAAPREGSAQPVASKAQTVVVEDGAQVRTHVPGGVTV